MYKYKIKNNKIITLTIALFFIIINSSLQFSQNSVNFVNSKFFFTSSIGVSGLLNFMYYKNQNNKIKSTIFNDKCIITNENNDQSIINTNDNNDKCIINQYIITNNNNNTNNNIMNNKCNN